MKKRSLLLPLMALLPLAAQDWEASLFVGQQSFRSADVLVSTGAGSVTTNWSIDNKVVFGVRGGYNVADLGPGTLQATLAFQPNASATARVKTPAGDLNGNYKTQYWSLGAMYNHKSDIFFGAGLEYRMEKLQGSIDNAGVMEEADSVNYARPWFRANVGYTFQGSNLKPFVGLEVAVPLTSTSAGDVNDNDKLTKFFAPRSQVSLIAGVRF